MSNLNAYINKYGISHVENDYGEYVYTTSGHVMFPNFYCASIITKTDEDGNVSYSVAMCDWNGYFDWCIMDEYGAKNGCFTCNDENDVIEACEIIRHYQACNNVENIL